MALALASSWVQLCYASVSNGQCVLLWTCSRSARALPHRLPKTQLVPSDESCASPWRQHRGQASGSGSQAGCASTYSAIRSGRQHWRRTARASGACPWRTTRTSRRAAACSSSKSTGPGRNCRSSTSRFSPSSATWPAASPRPVLCPPQRVSGYRRPPGLLA